MTPEELAAIKARAGAATPGPWARYPRKRTAIETWLVRLNSNGESMWTWDGFVKTGYPADADFIAHAREDIPALLVEVERLQSENEELRHALKVYGDADSAWA